MKFFTKLRAGDDWGILVLRLAVGVIFLYHGVQKWDFWGMEANEQMTSGMLNLFKFLSIVEPLGGIALIVGFLTQLAALGLGIIMLGAIWFKMNVFMVGFSGMNEMGMPGWEFDIVLLAICFSLFFVGGGKLSLDKFWMGKKD